MVFDCLIPFVFYPVQIGTPIENVKEPKRLTFFVKFCFAPVFIGFTPFFGEFLFTFMARVTSFNSLPFSCKNQVIGKRYVVKSLDQNKRQGHQKVYDASKAFVCLAFAFCLKVFHCGVLIS